jgi:hypothetical protein
MLVRCNAFETCPVWPRSGQIGAALARPLTGRNARDVSKELRLVAPKFVTNVPLTEVNDLENRVSDFYLIGGRYVGWNTP